MLRNGFASLVQKQQENTLSRMSRSSRSGRRRNIILREALEAFEEILKTDSAKEKRLTKSINETLGDLYKPLADGDLLAF